MLFRASVACCVVAIPFTAACSRARDDSRAIGPASAEEARTFVERFYAWYVPMARAEDGLRRVMKERREVLSDSLYVELQADSEAQARATEVVSLDGDPFLLSQDPCARYRVGAAVRVGPVIQVRVECADGNQYQRGVIAEVALMRGTWRLVNVLDLDGGHDLRSVLRQVAPPG